MPRLCNRNPRYCKHKASGQAIVTIGGRCFYLGPWNTKASKIEYDRIIGEWLAAGRHLPGSQIPDLAVAELVERFYDHAKTYYRLPDGTPSREVENFKSALSLLNRLYGETPAAEFGPLALESIRVRMIEAGWCRRVVNRQTDRVKAVFKWGVGKQLVPSAVYESLRCVSGLRTGRTTARESDPVRPVSDADVAATLPHLTSVVRGMVQLQRLTAARPGEICSMRVGEIDRTGDVWTYTPSTHKTQHHGHRRIIYLGPKAQDVIRPFLMKTDLTAFVFNPRDAVAEMRQRRAEARVTPLSCGNVAGRNRKRRHQREPGESYDVSSYRRAIARACDAAGLERWHPHQLRHTAATEVRKHFGLEAAQHVLGHSTLAVTELYAEKNADTARSIAARIG